MKIEGHTFSKSYCISCWAFRIVNERNLCWVCVQKVSPSVKWDALFLEAGSELSSVVVDFGGKLDRWWSEQLGEGW